jgi:hypothetical protein
MSNSRRPLLRAAYLSQRHRQQRRQQQGAEAEVLEVARDMETYDSEEEKGRHSSSTVTTALVTLVIPWLESADDRVALSGPDWQDATEAEPEKEIRQWLAVSAGLPLEVDSDTGLQIQFYPGLRGLHALAKSDRSTFYLQRRYVESRTKHRKTGSGCLIPTIRKVCRMNKVRLVP